MQQAGGSAAAGASGASGAASGSGAADPEADHPYIRNEFAAAMELIAKKTFMGRLEFEKVCLRMQNRSLAIAL